MTSSPMVQNVPLILPMAVDETGFPFDREEERDSDSFRSQLDDLAKRHPEFAGHFDGFPFRSDRARPPRAEDPEFRRFTERPFGSSRFERFGFPFNREFFDEEQPRAEPSQQAPQQEDLKQQQQQQQQPEECCGSASNSDQSVPPQRGRKQNIQQSNTVDLGQKQEPVNDRNQRSMSAPPPDNRQRYVSSINIPINRDGGMGDMGATQSQQPQQQQQEKPANKPTERVIPIHVEGRDEPVIPKHAGPSFTQQQPQPERIFGHRPTQFTQFVNREPARAKPEDLLRQQQQKPAPKPQEIPVPKPQEAPQQEAPPEPKPQPATPIDVIQLIQKDVSALMNQVEQFSGQPRDKQYLYLDEMLTRNLIKLDNVDTQGQENIRQARKEAIKCIEKCISILEAKAQANVPQPESMEIEAKPEEIQEVKTAEPPVEEKMETVETKEEKVEEAAPVVETKMEEEVATETPPKEESITENTENEGSTEEKKEKKKGKKKVVKKEDSTAATS